MTMKKNSYINAKGKEIIICNGGWKISKEKMQLNKIKHLEEAKSAAKNRLPGRERELAEAIKNNEPGDFIEYLRAKVSDCKMAMA
jgi:hypothetical protein